MKDVAVKNRKLKIGNRKFPPAFTLVELMVVIALIALISAITLPSVVRMFTAGADSQAHNIIAAQLSYARAIAIQNNTYAGVHVQMADAKDNNGDPLNPDLEETCYSAVVWDDPNDDPTIGHRLVLFGGSKPKKIPGSIAFGQLNGYVSGSNYSEINTPALLASFTTFTIVFSPSGQVVTRVAGGNIVFYNDGLFGTSDPAIWNYNTASPGTSGATFITMFDYIQLKNRDDDERDAYLNEAGQFLTINVYTGQLFPRK